MTDVLLLLIFLALCWIAIQLQRLNRRLDRFPPLAALLLASGAAGAQPSPASEWAAAVADAEKLPPGEAQHTRYVTAYALPEEDWDALYKLYCSRIVGLSRIPEPILPRRVTKSLWAFHTQHSGVDPKAYGSHWFVDPYFHVPVSRDGVKEEDRADGAYYLGGVEPVERLKLLTQSVVPLLRADWEWVRASSGQPYYDFLGVKNRADYHKLVGADPAAVERLGREWRAIVENSGIAYFPRQIVRVGVNDGGMWTTRDVLDTPKGERNVQRKLHKAIHDVEESIAPGPGGLPVFLLNDAKGELQVSAPDRVGPDKTRKGNRTILTVGTSCTRCHKQGYLQPIDDWAANTLQLPLFANLPNDEYNRVRSLFFRGNELQRKLAADRVGYEARLLEVTGLTSAKHSAETIRIEDWYSERRLTIADVARELGTTEVRLSNTLQAHAAAASLDPALAALLKPKGTIRREALEELFGVLMAMMMGVK